MKKILAFVAMMSFVLSAAAAVDSRLFAKDTLPESWEQTRAAWAINGILEDANTVKTEAVEAIAYGAAKRRGHPSGDLTREQFNALFRNQNNLTADLIPAADLVARAQGAGIYLPETKVAQAAVVEASKPTVATPVAATPQAVSGEVAALEAKLAKLSQDNSAEVTALRKEVSGLKAGFAGAVTKSDLEKVASQAAGIRASLDGRLTSLEKTVTAIKQGQEQTGKQLETLTTLVDGHTGALAKNSERLAAVEGKVGGSIWLWALGLVALALALYALLRKSSGVTVDEVKKLAKGEAQIQVSHASTAINRRVDIVEQTAKQAATQAENLRQDLGHKLVQFDAEFGQVIASLKSGSAAEKWLCRIGDDEDGYTLIFKNADADKVQVFGIDGQTNLVRLSSLKGVIGRAAQGDPHRIVGASAYDLETYQQSQVPESEAEMPKTTVSPSSKAIPAFLRDQPMLATA